MRVGSLVPDGYPTYGRVLHAASSALGDEKVRWSDIAAHHDRPLGAQTRFNELVDWHPAPDRQSPPWPWEQPDRGSLTPGECEALAGILARHTTTPDRCWFCLWEGYGWAVLPAPGHGPPRVKLEHRDCLLFAGAVRGGKRVPLRSVVPVAHLVVAGRPGLGGRDRSRHVLHLPRGRHRLPRRPPTPPRPRSARVHRPPARRPEPLLPRRRRGLSAPLSATTGIVTSV